MSITRYVDSGGTRYVNENGDWHREDGPAIIYANGSKFWYKNGLRHRLDGPAVERSDCAYGSRHKTEWFINGKSIDIQPILERFDISPDWRNWTDAEKMIVRLALP